jgi:hypothetical protein
MNSIWGTALFVFAIGLALSVLVSITTIQLWIFGGLSAYIAIIGLSVAIVMGLLSAGLLIISKVLDPDG